MSVLGFWVTVLAFGASLLAAVNYHRNTQRKSFFLRPPRMWVRVSSYAIAVASSLLLYLLITHDYSNGYVYSYSSNDLPFHFLVSSFYAGQEGSFLFWTLCSAVIALVLMNYSADRKVESSVMTVFMAVQSFLILLLIAKSPFQSLWQMIPEAPAGQVPVDGHGLNPLLQNFWMVIHPPVLFVGFAAMAVPFSFAISALWRREYQGWSSYAFPWLLFATAVLGAGLMLGAYWAYGVLGWGGYWGWDPVENSSLVPWLTAAALIHTLLAQRRREKFVRTNLALAIVTFFLTIYSTFLTRSGILGDASVHSFTDPGATVYWLLLSALALISGSGGVLMVLRRKELKGEVSESTLISREMALGAGAIVLILSAAVVLFGTTLPIFSKTRVEPSFYDTTHLPIAVAIGLLIGFSLFTQWGVDEFKEMMKRSVKALVLSVVLTAFLFLLGMRNAWAVALVFAAGFAFFVNLEVGLTIVRGDPRFLGGKLAHIGIAIMLLGIISTGKYSSMQHVALPLNQPVQVLGHTMTYVGSQLTPDRKTAFNVVVENGGKKFQLAPMMFESGQQGVMRNPDIESFLTKDFYISPVSLDEPRVEATGETYTIPKGETVSIGDVKARFVKFDMGQHGMDGMADGNGMTIGSVLELTDGTRTETVTPIAVYSQGGPPTFKPCASKLFNANIQLVAMNVGMAQSPSTVTVAVHRSDTAPAFSETLVVEASIKPYINLLWGGTLIMLAGFALAFLKRLKEG